MQLRLLDTSHFLLKKSIGTLTIDLAKVTLGTVYDDWRPLDAGTGDLRIVLHLCKLALPKPTDLSIRMHSVRLQLERNVYYPGQTVRGCLVFGAQKHRKYHGVSVAIEGYAHTEWAQGSHTPAPTSSRHQYQGAVKFLSHIASFKGGAPPLSSTDKKDSFDVAPGAHLYPFECTLPMDAPPSLDTQTSPGLRGLPPYDQFPHPVNFYLVYRVVGFVDRAGKSDKVSALFFKVLPHPSLELPGESLSVTPLKHSTSDVQVKLSGKRTALAGEGYDLTINIDNKSPKRIDFVRTRLMYSLTVSGKSAHHGWSQKEADHVILTWDSSNLSNLPIEPGTNWSQTLKLPMPEDLDPSLHSSQSPLIQAAYYFEVEASESESAGHTMGSADLPIYTSGRFKTLTVPDAPTEPEGPIDKLFSAPAPEDFAGKLIPAPSTSHKDVECYGREFGSIANYPNAFEVKQFESHLVFQLSTPLEHYPNVQEWTPGKAPCWLDLQEASPSPYNMMPDSSSSSLSDPHKPEEPQPELNQSLEVSIS